MNLKKIGYYSIVVLLLLFSSAILAKGEGDKKSSSLRKTTGQPSYTKFNINNISTWVKNDGETDISQSGNAGLVFPKGQNKTAIFQSGLLWGGTVDGQFRIGGSAYRQGTVPGRILPDGTAEDPEAPDVRIYRVRRDYKTANLQDEVTDGDGATQDEVRAQYEKDWNEWPADQGAPYEDVDGDGKYDPTVDIPGVAGADQTIWFVCNDLDAAQTDFMYGSPPMGIEEQVTVWGYKSTSALGNMLFRKFLLINKNADHKDFSDMYVCMWSDPDLGDAGDDFVGCDTTLSLGYVYNANPTDATYNPLPPPAAGFDFFQGPIVPGTPGDTAIFKGQYIPGKKNLPMTAFFFFINNPENVYTDPVQGDYQNGTLQWLNLFQGKISSTGQDFVDPNTGMPTKFTLAGDPVTGTGWIDGQIRNPGDRRLGMVSGTFNMAYGDTQEVVVAEICAGATPGIDRLQAVTLLKDYDATAQFAYDNLFNLPSAPRAPEVTWTPLDRGIILSWGDNPGAVSETEGYDNVKFGYKFEGYNVYQLPSASATIENAKRLATFDVVDGVKQILDSKFDSQAGVTLEVVTAYGSDSGIKRYLKITNDATNGNIALNNGSRYYFAVTAYAYNLNPAFGEKVLESSPIIYTVIPQTNKPGQQFTTAFGDSIGSTHSAGVSDGSAYAVVIDPSQVTGHSYQVYFTDAGDGSIVWNVKDATTGTVKVTGVTDQNGDDSSPIVDGIQFRVSGPPNDFRSFLFVHNGAGAVDPPTEGCFAFNDNGFPTSDGLPPDGANNDRPAADQQSDGSGGKWGIHTGVAGIGDDASYETFLGRVARGTNFSRIVPYDFEIRFTSTPSMSWFYYTTEEWHDVPFEVWNIGIGTPNDPSDDYKLMPLILDENEDGVFDLDGEDHSVSSGDNDPETDWFYIYDVEDKTPGTSGFDAAVAAGDGTGVGDEIMARLVLVNWNGGSISDPTFPANVNQQMPEPGSIFRIVSTKPNAASDVFTIQAPAFVSGDADLAKEDVKKINVFPNPYYGVNPQELNKYQRFVTFTHLPTRANFKIFNLAGQLVRSLSKDSNDQFFRWDLNNEAGLPAASGLYIVYIDMPDLGTTKILKLAIIQEQQVLDRF